MITLEAIKANVSIDALIRRGNENLGHLGFTEHGYRHISLVAKVASSILQQLGYEQWECELAAIAGYLHDIGNVVTRDIHAEMGAVLAHQLLTEMKMEPEHIALVVGAIGNHDEHRGNPISNISAALILADKADVHRSRVRNRDFAKFDIHDRVNYAVEKSTLKVDCDTKVITLELTIDIEICPVMEYFEIFLTRMVMSRRAAELLGCQFELLINKAKLL